MNWKNEITVNLRNCFVLPEMKTTKSDSVQHFACATYLSVKCSKNKYFFVLPYVFVLPDILPQEHMCLLGKMSA